MLRKSIAHVITGVGIAFIVSMVMLNIFARESSGAEILDAFLVWLVAGAFYGLASMLFESKVSGVFVLLLHYAINLVISFVAVVVMFSFAFGGKVGLEGSYLSFFLIFTGIYLVIFLGMYFYERADVNQLNRKLQARKG